MWERLKRNANIEDKVRQVEEFNKNNRWRKRGFCMNPLKYGLTWSWIKSTSIVNVGASDGSGECVYCHLGNCFSSHVVYSYDVLRCASWEFAKSLFQRVCIHMACQKASRSCFQARSEVHARVIGRKTNFLSRHTSRPFMQTCSSLAQTLPVVCASQTVALVMSRTWCGA